MCVCSSIRRGEHARARDRQPHDEHDLDDTIFARVRSRGRIDVRSSRATLGNVLGIFYYYTRIYTKQKRVYLLCLSERNRECVCVVSAGNCSKATQRRVQRTRDCIQAHTRAGAAHHARCGQRVFLLVCVYVCAFFVSFR